MAPLQVFEVTELEGRQYVSTTYRGVDYTLMALGDAWFVASHRKSLGRGHIGGGKHYSTLDDVAANCPAFRDFYAMEAA